MFILTILLCLFYILKYPAITVNAAANGLVLWYERVLPALLPFAILSNIIIASDILPTLVGKILPVLNHVFPLSAEGTFVLFSGYLFGFPMGSKNCAKLLCENKISQEEANVLFIITNNISPVFIQSYILEQQLQLEGCLLQTLLILYLPPLLLGRYLLSKEKTTDFNHKKTASRSKINFQIVDAGIMNGFETLTKIGGYIMIFSILASCFTKLPIPNLLKLCCIGVTELTNGIHILSKTALTKESQYILAIIFTAFGGFSGIAQTSAMIKDTSLSMKKYCFWKIVLAFLSGILAVIFNPINPL